MDSPASQTIKDFSRLTDCVSRLLHCLGCPHQLRGFIDALLGMGDGNWLDWVEISDRSLGWRIRTDQPAVRRITSGNDMIRCIEDSEKIIAGLPLKKQLREETVIKGVQRYRKKFMEWQAAIGVELIEVQPGGKKKERYFATRYRFPIGAYLEEILASAEAEPDYLLAPDEVFERITRRQMLAAKMQVTGAMPRDRFNRSAISIESEMKRALTALKKTLEMSIIREVDFSRVVGVPMVDEIEKLIGEYRQLMADEVQVTAIQALARAGRRA